MATVAPLMMPFNEMVSPKKMPDLMYPTLD